MTGAWQGRPGTGRIYLALFPAGLRPPVSVQSESITLMANLDMSFLADLAVQTGLVQDWQVSECQHDSECKPNDPESLLRVMRKTGYKGYVGVEYVWIDWQHCNEVDNLSETVLWRRFLLAHAGKKSAAHA